MAYIVLLFAFTIALGYFFVKNSPNKKDGKIIRKLLIFGIISAAASAVGLFYNSPIDENNYAQMLFYYFIIISLSEELFKYLASYIVGKKNKLFDNKYDAIFCASFISLGFATIENLIYFLNSPNLLTALSRVLLGGPIHICCGILIGYFYYTAKENKENKKSYWINILYSFLIPILFHGMVDFMNKTVDNMIILIILIVLRIFFTIYLLRKAKKISEEEKGLLEKNSTKIHGLGLIVILVIAFFLCLLLEQVL